MARTLINVNMELSKGLVTQRQSLLASRKRSSPAITFELDKP